MNRKQHFRPHVQGESLENKINQLGDEVFEALLPSMVTFAASVFIWMIYLGFLPVSLLSAVFMTILLVVFSVRAFVKIRKLNRQIKNHRKGLDGERYVGTKLERLSSNSTFVFHDVVCGKFNIDHVIISTKGIFTIDTKNWALPDRDYNKADFIFKDGELIDSTGVLQSDLMHKIESQGRWLEGKINEWTKNRYPVYRVGIMIGAYVDNINKDFSKYWIINDGAFAGFFDKEREKYPLNDVLRIADSLQRFIEKPIS